MTFPTDDSDRPAMPFNVVSLDAQMRDATETEPSVPRTPAAYIRSLGRLRSEQQWEAVRDLLHGLVMQRLPSVEIARVFGVSPDTIGRWKKRLFEDMRKEAVNMQPRDYICESLGSLREVRAEAWKGFHASASTKERCAYLQIVVQAENQWTRFGSNIGLYGERGMQPLSPSTYGREDGSPAAMGARLIQRMLQDLMSPKESATGDGASASETVVADQQPESYDALLVDVRPQPPAPPRTPSPVRVRERGPQLR